MTYKPGDGLRKTRRSARGAGDSRRRRRTRRHRRPLGRREQSRRRIGQGRPPRLVRLDAPICSGTPSRRPLASSGPYGFGGPVTLDATAGAREGTPAPATPKQGVDYSGTNVQEEGVDEPDLVKTNGNTLFAVANGKLNAVDVRGAKPQLLDTLTLAAGSSYELLLHGNRLLVLSRGGYWAEPMPAIAARMMPYQPAESVLTEVDVSNPGKLRVVRTLTLDGAYVSARLVGASVRIVVAAQVPEPAAVRAAEGHDQGGARRGGEAQPRRRSPRRASRAGSRPTGSSGRARSRRRSGRSSSAATCAGRSAFSGLGMLTVLTIDLAKGLEPDRLGRGDDRRSDRLCLAREPLRRDRALGRPARARPADAGAGRRHDRDPQVRHLEPGADAVSRERRGVRLPAQPVVAVRVRRRAARRQHRDARLVGRAAARPSRS